MFQEQTLISPTAVSLFGGESGTFVSDLVLFIVETVKSSKSKLAKILLNSFNSRSGQT